MAAQHIGEYVSRDMASFDEADARLTVPQQIGLFPDKPVLLQPGDSLEFAFEIVAAPKSEKLLAGLDVPLDSAVLINLWDWFRWICLALARLLLPRECPCYQIQFLQILNVK